MHVPDTGDIPPPPYASSTGQNHEVTERIDSLDNHTGDLKAALPELSAAHQNTSSPFADGPADLTPAVTERSISVQSVHPHITTGQTASSAIPAQSQRYPHPFEAYRRYSVSSTSSSSSSSASSVSSIGSNDMSGTPGNLLQDIVATFRTAVQDSRTPLSYSVLQLRSQLRAAAMQAHADSKDPEKTPADKKAAKEARKQAKREIKSIFKQAKKQNHQLKDNWRREFKKMRKERKVERETLKKECKCAKKERKAERKQFEKMAKKGMLPPPPAGMGNFVNPRVNQQATAMGGHMSEKQV